jgi:acetyltransferase-like isoleucine patch superfamily enzyme
VHWTPSVAIGDRNLLSIGDDAILGHDVTLLSHVINSSGSRKSIYVKTIRIGRNAFVGAFSRLAPGSKVEADAMVPAVTTIYVNEKFTEARGLETEGPVN